MLLFAIAFSVGQVVCRRTVGDDIDPQQLGCGQRQHAT